MFTIQALSFAANTPFTVTVGKGGSGSSSTIGNDGNWQSSEPGNPSSLTHLTDLMLHLVEVEVELGVHQVVTMVDLVVVLLLIQHLDKLKISIQILVLLNVVMLEELVSPLQNMVEAAAVALMVLVDLLVLVVVDMVELVELDGNFQQLSKIQQWLQVIQLVQIHIKEVVV